MEGEAIEESIVRGHHKYKEVWRPVIGQELPVLSEYNVQKPKSAKNTLPLMCIILNAN